jgi:hypothetical protein
MWTATGKQYVRVFGWFVPLADLAKSAEKCLPSGGKGAFWRRLIASLSLPRHGKSSGEPRSVMI